LRKWDDAGLAVHADQREWFMGGDVSPIPEMTPCTSVAARASDPDDRQPEVESDDEPEDDWDEDPWDTAARPEGMPDPSNGWD
jgi:hypothetical protein